MTQKQDSRSNLLEGNIFKTMLSLSIPAILGMVVIGLYNFMDAVFVGRMVGPEAMTAVKVSYPFTLLNSGIATLIGTGSASVLSRAVGRKDQGTINQIMGNLIALIALLSLIIPAYPLLPPSPLSDDFSQSAIYIFPGFPAFLRVISSCFEHEFYQQAGADRQHALQHRFRKNEVRAVRIEQGFPGAFVRNTLQPFFHSADISAGIPKHIVLRTDKDNLTLDPFYFDLFFFPQGMHLF